MTWNQPNQSPWDPAIPDLEPQTMPMDEIIRLAIDASMKRMHVWLPAVIIKLNGNQSVDIQPLLQVRYIDGRVVNRPVIRNVPVEMPNGNGYSIKLPISVGDTGRAVFCDRSLDNWLASSGGIVDPQDSRQHDLADPVFVPGLVPFSKQTTDSTTDLVITNGQAQLRVQKAGTFIAKNSSNELLDLLVQITTQVQSLSSTLSTDTVNTVFGPTQLNAFSTYESIGNQLETLLNQLTTLKGS